MIIPMKIVNYSSKIFFLLGGLLFGVYSQVAYGQLSAKVDRQTLSIEETLTLRVRLSDKNNQGEPDFSLLESQFDVLSQHQSSQVQYANGKVDSYTEWTISLAPKRTGKLLIPSFNHLGFYSDAIEINVTKATAAPQGNLKEIFIETLVEKPSVYVQEQIILKHRLYYSRNVESLDAQPLELENATIEPLEDARFRRSIDGKVFNVAEFNFAIYPQESGELIIPSLTWQLKVATSQRPRSFFDTGRYEIRRLRTQEKAIEIKPKPAAFPADKTWLPATSLKLTESWSGEIESIDVGEPITRTITLLADSLMSSQLPDVLISGQQSGIKTYTEQPSFEDNPGSDGVFSKRVESAAYVFSEPGKITIPAIEIPWWDTKENRMKYARLPEKTINISGEVANIQNAQAANTQSINNGIPKISEENVTYVKNENLWIWQVATFLFALLWIGTLIFNPFYRQPDNKKKDEKEPNEQQELKKTFKQLEQACSQNDAIKIKQALAEWGKLYLKRPSPVTFIELNNEFSNQDLKTLLTSIDNQLYGDSAKSDFTEGLQLLSILKQILKSRTQKSQDNVLEPLYFNN